MTKITDSDIPLDIVATDFSMAIRQVLRRLRSEANPSELNLSQMGALARLEQGGPMTTAELARVELMKPQSMGIILASLEQEGLIERCPHPTDRRQIHFLLTDEGRAVRSRHQAVKQDWLIAALAKLDPDDLKMLTIALPIIRQIGES